MNVRPMFVFRTLFRFAMRQLLIINYICIRKILFRNKFCPALAHKFLLSELCPYMVVFYCILERISDLRLKLVSCFLLVLSSKIYNTFFYYFFLGVFFLMFITVAFFKLLNFCIDVFSFLCSDVFNGFIILN